MPARSVLVRVRAGQLEPLEELHLEEGSEIRIILEIPEASRPGAKRPVKFRSWHLGVKGPITRKEIYEDVG